MKFHIPHNMHRTLCGLNIYRDKYKLGVVVRWWKDKPTCKRCQKVMEPKK